MVTAQSRDTSGPVQRFVVDLVGGWKPAARCLQNAQQSSIGSEVHSRLGRLLQPVAEAASSSVLVFTQRPSHAPGRGAIARAPPPISRKRSQDI